MAQFNNLLAWNIELLPRTNRCKSSLLHQISQIKRESDADYQKQVALIMQRQLQLVTNIESDSDIEQKIQLEKTRILSLYEKYARALAGKHMLAVSHGLNLKRLHGRAVPNCGAVLTDRHCAFK